MSVIEFGSQKGDTPKTPTLRQWCKQMKGVHPVQSMITVIFKPGKLPNWSFVCSHGFRVNVFEDSPLHGIISDTIEEWRENGNCLVVTIQDGLKGHWSLGLDTNETAKWVEYSWGYKITIEPKKDPAKTKTRQPRKPRPSTKPLTDIPDVA